MQRNSRRAWSHWAGTAPPCAQRAVARYGRLSVPRFRRRLPRTHLLRSRSGPARREPPAHVQLYAAAPSRRRRVALGARADRRRVSRTARRGARLWTHLMMRARVASTVAGEERSSASRRGDWRERLPARRSRALSCLARSGLGTLCCPCSGWPNSCASDLYSSGLGGRCSLPPLSDVHGVGRSDSDCLPATRTDADTVSSAPTGSRYSVPRRIACVYHSRAPGAGA